MLQFDLLGAARIMHHRTGCDGSRAGTRQPKAFEPVSPQLPFQERNGIIRGVDPLLEAGLGADLVDLRFQLRVERGHFRGEQQLAGLGLDQLIDAEADASRAGELHGRGSRRSKDRAGPGPPPDR